MDKDVVARDIAYDVGRAASLLVRATAALNAERNWTPAALERIEKEYDQAMQHLADARRLTHLLGD